MSRGGANDPPHRERRRRGPLPRIPAVISLLALAVGAFLLGRGSGQLETAVAIALMVAGLASLRVWRVAEDRERRRLEQAAYTDPLTGLANRRLLLSMLRHEISRHMRLDARFVVLMLDLDGFKEINDVYGHDAGDDLLCSVADALTATLRAQDTVARLGGDEFCVVAPDTEDERTLAQRVLRAVGSVGRGHENLHGSVGLAMFPEDGGSTDKLLRVADDRLIAAKQALYGEGRRRDGGRGGVRTAA